MYVDRRVYSSSLLLGIKWYESQNERIGCSPEISSRKYTFRLCPVLWSYWAVLIGCPYMSYPAGCCCCGAWAGSASTLALIVRNWKRIVRRLGR